MTHDAAVRTVISLVPEIEKKGAESVLRDYAVKEDLPPAQLEKLAQVFNTLRTVSHIEKAADRGSSVDLVDVPELVVSYALKMGHEKKALAPRSEQTHLPSQVDLMSALRNELAAPKPAREVEKAAAATTTVPMGVLVDAAAELAADARLTMSKLANVILNAVPCVDGCYDLAPIERDAANATNTTIVKNACDWLEQTIRIQRKTSFRHDYTKPLVKQAFSVGNATAAALVELSEALVTYELMEKIAVRHIPRTAELTTEEILAAVGGPQHTTGVPDAETSQADFDKLPPEAQAKVIADLKAQGIDIEGADEEEEENNPPPPNNTPSTPRPTGGGQTPPPTAPAGKSTDAPAGKSSPPIGLRSNFAEKAWDATKGTLKGVANATTSARNALDAKLTQITSKERTNKSQRSTDISVEDVRRAINVRRMIGTDAVLREADPREVLEIYNSVARLNPEIAHNMPAMKLLLREAVSYEGLTLDSQKQLTDIRKGTGESEAKEYDNDKRRYAVGGALPIGPPSRKA